jgi:hypothetical protein
MTPRELQEAFRRGENISALLRSTSGQLANTEEIIEVAYDLQAGSYIAGMGDAKYLDFKSRYMTELAEVIRSLGLEGPLLEAGVGEATTLRALSATLPGRAGGPRL